MGRPDDQGAERGARSGAPFASPPELRYSARPSTSAISAMRSTTPLAASIQ
jgi:hypothetical protein